MRLPMEVGSRSSLGTQHMQLDAPTRRVPATVRTKSKGGCCRLLSIGITELHASLQYNRKVLVEMVIIGYFHVHKFVKKDTCSEAVWSHGFICQMLIQICVSPMDSLASSPVFCALILWDLAHTRPCKSIILMSMPHAIVANKCPMHVYSIYID